MPIPINRAAERMIKTYLSALFRHDQSLNLRASKGTGALSIKAEKSTIDTAATGIQK